MSLLLALQGPAPTVCISALANASGVVKYMRKNVAGQNIEGQMLARTDGSPLTTSVSVFVTVDNGTQTAGGGTTTHKGNGQWNYAPTQAETNGNHVAFLFTHASGVNQVVNVYPVAYNPYDAVALGLTNLTVAPTNWLTSVGIAAGALNGKGDWNIGKTNYSIAGTKTTLDALNDVSTSAITAAIAARVMEGTITWEQAFRIMLSATAGKASGLEGTTVSFRDTPDTKNRIVATVDSNGNRTAVTLDGT